MGSKKRNPPPSITQEHRTQLLRDQLYRCKICGRDQLQNGKRLSLDHCHETGEIRGLLCNNCNLGLGNFRDNPTFLREAIRYLQDFEAWYELNRKRL